MQLMNTFQTGVLYENNFFFLQLIIKDEFDH